MGIKQNQLITKILSGQGWLKRVWVIKISRKNIFSTRSGILWFLKYVILPHKLDVDTTTYLI